MLKKKLLLISCLLLLSNCASKQSYIGASSTAAVAGTACWQYLSDNPAVVATCAVAEWGNRRPTYDKGIYRSFRKCT